jgi:HEAT repeat protein
MLPLVLLLVIMLPAQGAAEEMAKQEKVETPERQVYRILGEMSEVENKYPFVMELDELGPDGLEFVIHALRHGSDHVRYNAVYALGRMRVDPELAVKHIASALSDEEFVHLGAVEQLEEFGNRAWPTFRKELKGDDAERRESAVYAIGRLKIKHPVALRMLRDMARKEERSVRGSAVHALGEIGVDSPEIMAVLIGALEDEDNRVRMNAALALGKLKNPDETVIAALEKAKAEDENPWVQKNAEESLKRLAKIH